MVGSKGDGYLGRWDPQHSVAGSEEFDKTWPLKPPHRATLFTLGRDGTDFIWTCRECGWAARTEGYVRPAHPKCNSKKKGG